MPSSNKRLISVIKNISVIIVIGLIYGYVLIPMGWHIPCVFKDITGLKCPGCGLTSICLKILHMDLDGILEINYGLWVISPVLAYLIIESIVIYIKSGKTRNHNLIITLTIIWLIFWTIIRNIYGV